eukprot:7288975-Ditylum_brightwellii.AAC.1
MASSKHNQVTLITVLCSTQYGYISHFDNKYANNSDGQNSSRQGSDNDLLCHYRQKHSTINLLKVNEEGDETSEEGFNRDGSRHYGNKHGGGSD